MARVESFVTVHCPKCGGAARRDTDTMDTFVDSCWYYFRYLDPRNDPAAFDWGTARPLFPVNLYIGGIEHATMHLIYTRLWTKVMRDLGLVTIDEPGAALFTQGMVIKDGAKMSKSKGNVVDPDHMVERFGADTTRLFSLFAAPPERDLDWSESGVEGCYRFLSRVWRAFERSVDRLPPVGAAAPAWVTPFFASIETVKAVPKDDVLFSDIIGSFSCSTLSGVRDRQISPLPYFAMKLIASGVTFLGRHAEVAFVLPVFIVNKDDHLAIGNILDRLINGVEFMLLHAPLLCVKIRQSFAVYT